MAGSDQALAFNMPARALDKIFYRPTPSSTSVSQSASPAVPTYVTVTIAHGYGETFFIDAQMSPDGSNWYDFGFEPTYYDSGAMLTSKRFSGEWGVDSTNVTLRFAAYDNSYTMRYRLVGYTKE